MFSALWGASENADQQPPVQKKPPPLDDGTPERPAAGARRDPERLCMSDFCAGRDRQDKQDDSILAPEPLARQESGGSAGRNSQDQIWSDPYGHTWKGSPRQEMAPSLPGMEDSGDEDEDSVPSSRSEGSEEEYQKRMKDLKKAVAESMTTMKKKLEKSEYTEGGNDDDDEYVREMANSHHTAIKEQQKSLKKAKTGVRAIGDIGDASTTSTAWGGSSTRPSKYDPTQSMASMGGMSMASMGDMGSMRSMKSMGSGRNRLRDTWTEGKAVDQALDDHEAVGVEVDKLENDDPEVVADYYDNWISQNRNAAVGLPDQVKSLRNKMDRDGTDMPQDIEDGDSPSKASNKLAVVFNTTGKREKEINRTIVFEKKPIGIKWSRSHPLTVTQVAQHEFAYSVGVQKGWIIKEFTQNSELPRKASGWWYFSSFSKDFGKAVADLPTAEEFEATQSRRGKYQAMTQKVKVHFESADSIPISMAVGASFLCSVEVPGKPHSLWKTQANPPDGFPEDEQTCAEQTPIPTWGEETNVFDYAAGEGLIIKMYKRTKEADKSLRNDTLLGAVELRSSDFFNSRQGQHDEHTLLIRRQAVNIKLKVRIILRTVPIKQQVVADYRELMKEKFIKLGIDPKDMDNETLQSDDPASAVRLAVMQYHKYSEDLGRWYPFPDKKDEQFLDQDRLEKLRVFEKHLQDEGDKEEVKVVYEAADSSKLEKAYADQAKQGDPKLEGKIQKPWTNGHFKFIHGKERPHDPAMDWQDTMPAKRDSTMSNTSGGYGHKGSLTSELSI